jgi:hypothetical protein
MICALVKTSTSPADLMIDIDPKQSYNLIEPPHHEAQEHDRAWG